MKQYNSIPELVKNEYGETERKRAPLETDYVFDNEKPEAYNDYYGDGENITRSEREFNLALGNDEPVYRHFVKNFKNYRDRLAKGENHTNLINELHNLGTWSKGDYNPKNIRKGYLQRILDNEEWLDK